MQPARLSRTQFDSPGTIFEHMWNSFRRRQNLFGLLQTTRSWLPGYHIWRIWSTFLAVSASIWTPADHTLVTVTELVGASGTPRSTWATQGDQASIRIERQGLPMSSRGSFLHTVECICGLCEQPLRARVFCKQFGSSRGNKQSNNQNLELQSVRVYACIGKVLRLCPTLQKQQPRTSNTSNVV